MKKNICLLISDISVVGGAERVTVNLANHLSQYYNVFIVNMLKKSGKTAFTLNNTNVIVHYLSTVTRLRYQVLLGIFNLRKYIKNHNIDVVISVGVSGNLTAVCAAIASDLKIIFAEHNNLKNSFSSYKTQVNKFLRWVGAKYADKIITLTNADKILYIDHYKIRESKIDFIYNFIDNSLMEHKNFYDKESKIILSVGRFDRVKGYEMLVRIARSIFFRYHDWQWHIYGDGDKDYINEIKNTIREFGLEDKVILKGESKVIYDIYRCAAIFVLTSYFEGLPMVLLEAKANYLPIVSFDCMTGPSEIIEDKKSGFLIETYNEEYMAEKICALIGDKEMRINFASHAQDNLYKFDCDTVVGKWVKLIDNL